MCHDLGVDDATFLAQVRDRLPEFVYSDYLVIAVQPTGGRPWLRTEVTFVLANPPSSWQGPTQGSAYFPLAEEWRYASGDEGPPRVRGPGHSDPRPTGPYDEAERCLADRGR